MIAAIIFDCFGVLTEDGWLAFLRQYDRPEIADELRDLNRSADRGILGYEPFLDEVCELTGASRVEAHRIITTVHHPNEAVFNIVRDLKSKGYILGIISNVGGPLSGILAEEYLNLFDHQTLSYQVGAIKPEPKIYEAFLAQAKVAAEESIFIDDREVNSEGAQAMGMRAITYLNPEQLLNELHEYGVKI